MAEGNRTKASELSTLDRELLAYLLQEEQLEDAPARIPRRAGPCERAPVSDAQRRLWFLNQFQPELPAYNIASAVRIEGRLSVGTLERTLSEIVRRHEALRTVFELR